MTEDSKRFAHVCHKHSAVVRASPHQPDTLPLPRRLMGTAVTGRLVLQHLVEVPVCPMLQLAGALVQHRALVRPICT